MAAAGAVRLAMQCPSEMMFSRCTPIGVPSQYVRRSQAYLRRRRREKLWYGLGYTDAYADPLTCLMGATLPPYHSSDEPLPPDVSLPLDFRPPPGFDVGECVLDYLTAPPTIWRSPPGLELEGLDDAHEPAAARHFVVEALVTFDIDEHVTDTVVDALVHTASVASIPDDTAPTTTMFAPLRRLLLTIPKVPTNAPDHLQYPDTAGAASTCSSATFGCVVNPVSPRCPVVDCDDGAVKAEQISSVVEAPEADDDEELVPFAGDSPYIGAPVMLYVDGVRYTGQVIEVNIGVRSRSRLYLIRYNDGGLQDVTEDEF